MIEPKRPYVGVSGVVSPEIQTSLETIATEIGLHRKDRLLALGVKAVHKTQFLDIENKYGSEWYPVGEEAFKNALRHDNPNPNTIAVAQSYLDIEQVDSWQYRQMFLKRIVERGRPWLQAIQFDMLPWHLNPGIWGFLEDVKEQGLEVFLQAHKHSMETLGARDTARLIGRYANKGIIDYVLFDSSHGTGKRLDTNSLRPFIAEAYDRFEPTKTGVAIAGGLNQQVVSEDLPALIAEYPNLSWDAEGQLHPVDVYGKKPLNLDIAADYLCASSNLSL